MEDKKLVRIDLKDMRFFGFYGLYPVEKKWITELSISLSLAFYANKKGGRFVLEDTIDYQEIYKVVAEVCAHPEGLIENIAQSILQALMENFDQLIAAEVQIAKKPQLGGSVSQVVVFMDASREPELH